MINKGLVIIFLYFFLSAVQSCDQQVKKSISITKEINFSKEGELTLRKTKSDSVFKTLDIEIAQTDYETQTGLMYRSRWRSTKECYLYFRKSNLDRFI